MPHVMSDFKRIFEALYSSNEMLRKEHLPDKAKRRLQEAEQSLSKAIHHALSEKRNIAQK
ncbi:MAG TPA: hypothetical protein DEO65_06275 [Bacillus bacterium]|uniref:Uncharacterized protein n=1 Tax=Siminovitchia fordii TaxID=254759 RepID=A0ABQ4K7E1_9BACI|nr:hypothetical protein [Siminovitchia fordii]GIN21090.1 hypothetical protein J1TS3_22240 [Siminovitchia fordii]HBZ09470.1 hypothetical protein [Bacillus sp. (in: firmicutes)]